MAKVLSHSEQVHTDTEHWIAGGLLGGKGQVQQGDRGLLLRLSQSHMRKLGLSVGDRVGVWPMEGGYRIGPYFGIMTNKRPGGRRGFQGLRGRRENYTALLRVARSMGVMGYVFACEDVDFKRMQVTGYRQNKEGKWYPRTYPLPNVVYNRIPDRFSEKSGEVIMAKRRFEQLGHTQGLRFFNPHFLNKWELYRFLSKDPVLKEYLPDTKVYSSPQDIQTGLRRYGMVYLKPRDSFAGTGIMRVIYRDGKYVLSVKEGAKYSHIPRGSFEQLMTLFKQYRRPGVYLVQQGLRLARYKGAIFDARIIVQKDGYGQWGLSGSGVRVAARGGITTHVPNGGYIAPIEVVLREVFNEGLEEPHGIYSHIKEIALRIATAIEERYGRLFGELSMDIGIDQKGNCFFFEANAKPMKFDEPTIRKKTLQRLIEFSRFLAGFQAEEGE